MIVFLRVLTILLMVVVASVSGIILFDPGGVLDWRGMAMLLAWLVFPIAVLSVFTNVFMLFRGSHRKVS